ncbi:uncharacterized protein C8A04DRAFT_38916 [Dichotomopilus funicola]|uniref:Uncharacterized protein n=1 Tax=Dichotomopilus funicola TaxID=1934379 RepID=A0AAN6ZL55_9PEZI|nr:hypothetical protein C8A04DRAFT_38916 [Dichotomopilus funicola]
MFSTTTRSPGLVRAAGSQAWLPIRNGAVSRCFSTTPAQRAPHIITFQESSTPELAELLDKYRQMIILPTYLSPEQRRKIYKPKIRKYLEHDPVLMEIDGVEHKFRYRSQVADLPSTKHTFGQVLHLTETPADFQNIPPLLEGFVRAGRKLDGSYYHRLIRKAAKHGHMQMILDFIQAAKRYGLKLNRSERINEVLVYLQWPAILSGWEVEATEKALRQVKLVINILETDLAHEPKNPIDEGAYPYFRDPQVLAARLHMEAARAVHLRGGKDEHGQVAKYAQQLVTLWPEGYGLLDLQPLEAYQGKSANMRYLLDRNAFLFYASPVLNGLGLAAQVVDPGLAMQLQNRADKVEGEIRIALADEKRNKEGRGARMYDSIFNPQPPRAEEEASAGEE